MKNSYVTSVASYRVVLQTENAINTVPSSCFSFITLDFVIVVSGYRLDRIHGYGQASVRACEELSRLDQQKWVESPKTALFSGLESWDLREKK